jgi:hypothetical protein
LILRTEQATRDVKAIRESVWLTTLHETGAVLQGGPLISPAHGDTAFDEIFRRLGKL